MTTHAPSTTLAAASVRAPTHDDLRAAAEFLVAHGRRADALALLTRTLDFIEDPRATLLLARLHLEAGTLKGAEEALGVLTFWRCEVSGDPEGIALMRCALHRLGRCRDVAKLDRDLGWTSTASRRRSTGNPPS